MRLSFSDSAIVDRSATVNTNEVTLGNVAFECLLWLIPAAKQKDLAFDLFDPLAIK